MDSLKCAGFEFFSNFDSANLAKVEEVPQEELSSSEPGNNSSKTIVPEPVEAEFNIWTKPDCCGTEFENANRTWFYFGMRANASSIVVKLNMVDLNRQAKMYSQGMAPVYKVIPGRPQWERIRDKPVYRTEGNIFILSFKYKTPENPQSITYFAFTYPFPYTEMQQMLDSIDKRFATIYASSKDDIYYARECVCHSLEGRRIDLLTISSHHNISAEREPRLKNLFPDENIPRPFRFVEKKVIFISARVHPGETPSSFVFNGFLNLLLNREDSVAIILRRLYVFKLIPCLNPDGVARGHYRTDTRGVNLNRMYLNPKFSLHPSIYASRSLIRFHHFGYEKEEEEERKEDPPGNASDSSGGESASQSDSKIVTEVSHMTLEEKRRNSNGWCNKCKGNMNRLENVASNISISFDDNGRLCAGREICCCDSTESKNSGGEAERAVSPPYSHGDANRNESGLFLYVDMHGHASKKGIFMYGNHFEDLDCNVECMLLPKIMSLNNHNFHFTACNFTERNMYLKDRRDGMSREGSGRVAVLKLTGLIRSYTLECNYNTGRLVNILPPSIREGNCRTHTLLVPPKYAPQIFEEVGRALGASILDLTSQNPNTRIPNSEFHTLNGLRDWLGVYCVNELGEANAAGKCKLKKSSSLHAQGKQLRGVFVKTRSSSTVAKKSSKGPRSAAGPLERKDSLAFPGSDGQPSCSRTGSGTRAPRSGKALRPKMKRDSFRFKGAAPHEKPTKAINHIVHNMQNTNCLVRQRLKSDRAPKLRTIAEKSPRPVCSTSEADLDRVELREICFVKDGEGKKVIAKYASEGKSEGCDDNLIVSWDPAGARPTVFSQKQVVAPFPVLKSSNEPGCSKQGGFRVHNFARSGSFNKGKRNKRGLRRLAASAEPTPKAEKLKKRKKSKTKIG